MDTDTKIFNKILAIWVQQYVIKILHYDWVWFIWRIQGWFKLWLSFSAFHHINRLKKKNCNLISIGEEKSFGEIPDPSCILIKTPGACEESRESLKKKKKLWLTSYLMAKE